MNLGLRDRGCVVTGASRGIGRATALALAAEGAQVLLVGRSVKALDEVAAGCRDAGGEGEVLTLDVTDPEAGERVLAACATRLNTLDALVNNAGTSFLRPLEELTDADWQSQWELHVMGPMRLMRALGGEMASRGGGRIVNVCSSSGKRPSLTNVAYSVTKSAQLSLSRAFAQRFAAEGVLVNAVAPGAVGSELWRGTGGLADQQARAQGIEREEALAAAAQAIPLGRLGTEAEIAAVITFLCSEQAAFVTGAAWSADGGSVPVII